MKEITLIGLYVLRCFCGEKGLFDQLILDKPSTKSPDSDSTEADSTLNDRWDLEDNAIIGLMISSIEPHIGSSVLFTSIAKQIWEHLKHVNSEIGNVTWIYETCKQYFELEKDSSSLVEYYSRLLVVLGKKCASTSFS